MGNTQPSRRMPFMPTGRRRERQKCQQKLDALKVTCHSQKPLLHPLSPDYLKVNPTLGIISKCCKSEGTRAPAPSGQWCYMAGPDGVVYSLGPADMEGEEPSYIYNVLGPDYPVQRGVVFRCSHLGEIAEGTHVRTPALAVIVHHGEKSEVTTTCFMGVLKGNGGVSPGRRGGLEFVPCGKRGVMYRVHAAQVAQIFEPYSQGVRNCLGDGGRPGYEAPKRLQDAHARTTGERASNLYKEAHGAEAGCSKTAGVLTGAVQDALKTIVAGAPVEKQREAVDLVREELRHAGDHECRRLVGVFLDRADPIVCLAEANAQLAREGHPPIRQGATPEEDRDRMRRVAEELAKKDSNSLAVGTLARCAGATDVTGTHARTSMDRACKDVPGVARMLKNIRSASTLDAPRAVRSLREALGVLPPSTPGIDNCIMEADRYITTSDAGKCRELLRGSPGSDMVQVAVDFLDDVKSGTLGPLDCEQYACLREVDSDRQTNVAENALKISTVHKTGGPLLSAVRSACSERHRRSLREAEKHMSGSEQWAALLNRASSDEDKTCAAAVAGYITEVENAEQKFRQECGGGRWEPTHWTKKTAGGVAWQV